MIAASGYNMRAVSGYNMRVVSGCNMRAVSGCNMRGVSGYDMRGAGATLTHCEVIALSFFLRRLSQNDAIHKTSLTTQGNLLHVE